MSHLKYFIISDCSESHNLKEVFVRLIDVCYFETKANILHITLNNGGVLKHRVGYKDDILTNRNLEKFLPDNFFRISRSIIINLDLVDSIDPWFSGCFIAKFGSVIVEFSRRPSVDFRKKYRLMNLLSEIDPLIKDNPRLHHLLKDTGFNGVI